MNEHQKQAIAELIGTFTLCFIGAGAGALAGSPQANTGVVGVAFAHGLALMVVVYAWGPISGAHVNPAVTFGIALTGRMPWSKAVLYWIAQFIGAALACYLLVYLIPSDPGLGGGATKGVLTGGGGVVAEPVKVILVEAILTFFLLTAVFASGVLGRNGNVAGIAIGLVLTMDIICGGWLTGASMNPARTFGPCLALGDFSYFWMYLVGPLLGGAGGALLYNTVFLPAGEQAPVRAASETKEKHRR